MIAETITGFASHLADEGFVISPERIGECLSVFTEEGIDCTEFNDMVSVMKLFFCSTKEESRALPELFEEYIRFSPIVKMKEQMDIEKARREKTGDQEKHEAKMTGLNAKKKELEEERKRIETEIYQESFSKLEGLSKNDRKFLEEKEEWIRSMDSAVIRDIINEHFVSSKDINDEEKKLLNEATKALMQGNTKSLTDTKKLFKILKTMSRNSNQTVKDAQEKAAKATRKTKDDLDKVLSEIQKEDFRHRQQQMEIDKAIRAMEQKATAALIRKDKSRTHREEFTGGKNFVQQRLGNEEYPKEAEKDFDRLTAKEKQSIVQYIRENILKFKTKMNRNLIQIDNGRIDMHRTIQEACRTGGRPFHLMKNLKRPGKTSLALILDVSGSCKNASTMLLTFMCLLKEVFPRGCKAYVFVNSLYDITELTRADNLEDAIESVLDLVPRIGQYSNYDKPLRALWNEHKADIAKDTIVLMMGDARNNKNPSAEEEWKNICRRAKKVYWLNTDTAARWDQGDSIASTYARYAPMYEIRNTKELLSFIDSGMR